MKWRGILQLLLIVIIIKSVKLLSQFMEYYVCRWLFSIFKMSGQNNYVQNTWGTLQWTNIPSLKNIK